jgi:hypothetical protein
MQCSNKLSLKILCLTVAVAGSSLVIEYDSSASGRKPVAPSCPAVPPLGQSQFSTPLPARKVRLPQIGTKAFQMPNGVQADLNFDMQTILNTSVTSSSATFSPTDAGSIDDPCNSHLELRSAVTTFQLDLVEAGISFGFSPAGSISTVSSITGAAKVRIGTIAIDLSLWQCDGGSCFAVAAATATHAVAGGNITFDADFSSIKTSAGLVFNTPLGATVRSIMIDGIKQLAASPRLSELAWTARVRDFNAVTGVVILSAGDQARVLPNQTFEVYAPTDTTAQGVCNVFQTVAYIHTSAVNTASSQAVIDQVLDPRGIQKGDVVMVRTATNNSGP